MRYLAILLILLATPLMAASPLTVSLTGAGTAGSSCAPATNEVGDRTDYSSEYYGMSGGIALCYLYTPDCSGNLEYAYAHSQSSGDAGGSKVCVYLDDGDNVPDSGDTKVGCSNEIGGTGVGWKISSSKVTGAVSTGSNYWVCIFSKPIVGWDITRTSTGTRTAYLYETDLFTTPPANLDGSWSGTASRDASMYVRIE